MTVETAELRITTPTGPSTPGRGFYQVEDDRLLVQIGLFEPERRFFSFLDAKRVRLDMDHKARLIFIDIRLPRRHWNIDSNLQFPENPELADVRWLDFRETLPPVKITSSNDLKLLHLGFSDSPITRTIYIADNISLGCDENCHLSSIWINNIQDDSGGKQLAIFRKQCLRAAGKLNE